MTLKTTLKAFPIITLISAALCFLTQGIAKLFGIELPDQANLEIVRRAAGWNLNFALLVLQIVVILPIVEELIFRLPLKIAFRKKWRMPGTIIFAAALSSLFSRLALPSASTHAITQPTPLTHPKNIPHCILSLQKLKEIA